MENSGINSGILSDFFCKKILLTFSIKSSKFYVDSFWNSSRHSSWHFSKQFMRKFSHEHLHGFLHGLLLKFLQKLLLTLEFIAWFLTVFLQGIPPGSLCNKYSEILQKFLQMIFLEFHQIYPPEFLHRSFQVFRNSSRNIFIFYHGNSFRNF